MTREKVRIVLRKIDELLMFAGSSISHMSNGLAPHENQSPAAAQTSTGAPPNRQNP